ncbi:MAG: ABC transporter substrate-binding protein [Proteobacteria bacterium]|nr:ABC transporter substrate-binding protein [Pseudomonadota bacterium]
MTRTSALNALGVALALGLAAVAMGYRPADHRSPRDRQEGGADARPPLRFRTLATGGRGLVDARGHTVPLRHYRRIVAGSTVARALLYELCEPDRIAGIVRYGLDRAPDSHRYAGKPTIESIEDVEAILSLHPDLVLVNSIASLDRVARLRDAGLDVFDLGQMLGLATLIPNIHAVGALVGHPDQARRYAEAFVARMRGVAADIPIELRKRGMYISIYGDRMLGGTAGTSYGDVLTHAGLLDAAAGRFHGWPQYSGEDVLAVDPDVIVTKLGMGAVLCRHPGLDQLRPCRHDRRGIVELPPGLVGDPGPGMLDTAEAIRRELYPFNE